MKFIEMLSKVKENKRFTIINDGLVSEIYRNRCGDIIYKDKEGNEEILKITNYLLLADYKEIKPYENKNPKLKNIAIKLVELSDQINNIKFNKQCDYKCEECILGIIALRTEENESYDVCDLLERLNEIL